MSLMNGNGEAIEKAQKANTNIDKKLDKSMGIETLTIFPKQVVDGKTIITAQLFSQIKIKNFAEIV